MIFLAVILALLAVLFFQDRGQITSSLWKRLASALLLVLSGIVLSFSYGNLRSIFILLGMLSLIGTLFTLLRYKLEKT